LGLELPAVEEAGAVLGLGEAAGVVAELGHGGVGRKQKQRIVFLSWRWSARKWSGLDCLCSALLWS
jgi:hypothetical protein